MVIAAILTGKSIGWRPTLRRLAFSDQSQMEAAVSFGSIPVFGGAQSSAALFTQATAFRLLG